MTHSAPCTDFLTFVNLAWGSAMHGGYGESPRAARPGTGPRRRRLRMAIRTAAVAVFAAVGVAGCQGSASSPAGAGNAAASALSSGAAQPSAPSGAAQSAVPSGTPRPALAWSAARAPLPADTDGVSGQYVVLDDVSCPAAGYCVAVGADRASSGSGDAYQGLAETLSGGAWHPAAIPDVSSANRPVSLSVSCPERGSCVAAGFAESSAKAGVPVIEQLSGGGWHPVTSPRPSDASPRGGALLTDVSCPVAGWCVATGWYLNTGGRHAAYVDTLSDGTWTAASVPLPADAAPEQGTATAVTYLAAVSCPGTGACVASGQYRDASGGTRPFAVTLSGGSWTAAAAPLPGDATAGGQLAGLWAVSCPAPGTCVGGGHYLNRGGQPRYLIDRLSGGTWTASAAPLPSGAAADQKWSQDQATVIGGLGCASASFCVATAGYVMTDNEIVPAIETLSGGTWTAARAPLPADAAPASGPGNAAFLLLATCRAPSSCLTVGSYPAADGTVAGVVETAAPRHG